MEEVAKKRPAKRARSARATPAPASVAKATAAPLAMAAPLVEAAAGPTVELAETITAAMPQASDAIETIEAVTSPATPRDALTAAETAPILEGPDVMATSAPTSAETFAMTPDKLQAMFGDVGARFKASFEKSSKLGEEMVELAKGNVEAVVVSARVAAKGSEALGQDAAEYGKKSLEHAVAVMKSIASVKSPTELFQLQSDFAKSSFDSAVAEASKFSESMMKLAGDVAQPISTRYAVAADKIKAVAL